MRFRDIPQFPSAHYEVDVPWKHIDNTLRDLSEGLDLRLDPEYQRGHVWTREQQTAYVEYQLMGGEVSRTIIFNSPDWYSDKAEYIELVDGKQRLEAVRAFMRGDLPAFGHTIDEFEDKLPTMEYRFRFQICTLPTRKEVLSLYLKINAGGTPHTQEELDRVRELLEERA